MEGSTPQTEGQMIAALTASIQQSKARRYAATKAKREARAKIRAAAPQLLAACEQFIDEMFAVDVLDPLDQPRRMAKLVPVVLAAITKARSL